MLVWKLHGPIHAKCCYRRVKESILEEWLLMAKLCTDFTLKHRWRHKIKKSFYINMVSWISGGNSLLR